MLRTWGIVFVILLILPLFLWIVTFRLSHPHYHIRSSISQKDKRSQSRELKTVDLVTSKFQKYGGPICREEVSSCPDVPCLNYSKWYNKMYSTSSSTQSRRRKVVLSVGHNGFGNQLFQHYFALQVAQYHNAVLYLVKIEVHQSPGLSMPPNTGDGAEWIDLVSDPKMLWASLPDDHPDKLTCLRSNLTYSKRPVDIRGRNVTQRALFYSNLLSFLDPSGEVECLISIGYFQNKDVCLNTVYEMWPKLVNTPTRPFVPAVKFDHDDLVIHLRCQPSHYGVPNIFSLQVIINVTYWTKLYIVRPPSCTQAVMVSLISLILKYPNSSVVKQSSNTTGFDDFILLSTANKLIEDVSTYSYWAGIFSNAAEKHVNAGFHDILKVGIENNTRLATNLGYIYHNPAQHDYFGRVDANGKFQYHYHLPSHENHTVNRHTHPYHHHQRNHTGFPTHPSNSPANHIHTKPHHGSPSN